MFRKVPLSIIRNFSLYTEISVSSWFIIRNMFRIISSYFLFSGVYGVEIHSTYITWNFSFFMFKGMIWMISNDIITGDYFLENIKYHNILSCNQFHVPKENLIMRKYSTIQKAYLLYRYTICRRRWEYHLHIWNILTFGDWMTYLWFSCVQCIVNKS